MGNRADDLAIKRTSDTVIFAILADRLDILKRFGNHVQPVRVAHHKDFFWQGFGFGIQDREECHGFSRLEEG